MVNIKVSPPPFATWENPETEELRIHAVAQGMGFHSYHQLLTIWSEQKPG